MGQPAGEWSWKQGGGRVQVSTRWRLPELVSATLCLERTEWKAHSYSRWAARLLLSTVAVYKDKVLNPKIPNPLGRWGGPEEGLMQSSSEEQIEPRKPGINLRPASEAGSHRRTGRRLMSGNPPWRSGWWGVWRAPPKTFDKDGASLEVGQEDDSDGGRLTAMGPFRRLSVKAKSLYVKCYMLKGIYLMHSSFNIDRNLLKLKVCLAYSTWMQSTSYL